MRPTKNARSAKDGISPSSAALPPVTARATTRAMTRATARATHSGFALINARLVDPYETDVVPGSLLIKDGRIDAVGRADACFGPDCVKIDCGGLCLAPGLVDMRVVLRGGGIVRQGATASDLKAAAAGGVTSLVCVPDDDFPIDQAETVGFIRRQAKIQSSVKVYPCAALSRGLDGRHISNMGILGQAGAVAFGDGWKTVTSSLVMHRAMDYSRTFDGLIIHHPQDPCLAAGGIVNAGEMAIRLGLAGIPPAAEAMMLERDIHLVRLSGARYHAAHISTGASVKIIERAKNEGLRVTCDTAPPYFALNELAIADYRTYAHLDPPLRSEEDRCAVARGISDGIIDAIASDHFPRDEESKRVPFEQSRPGAVGLETLLAVTLSLFHQRLLSLNAVMARLSGAPADILGLDRPSLTKNAPADVIVFDPDRPWIVDPSRFVGQFKNTPFDRHGVQGMVMMTIADGTILHCHDDFGPVPRSVPASILTQAERGR